MRQTYTSEFAKHSKPKWSLKQKSFVAPPKPPAIENINDNKNLTPNKTPEITKTPDHKNKIIEKSTIINEKVVINEEKNNKIKIFAED